MTHPLTDEICDALWDENGQYYALYEEVRLTCRASADWQLEQVIEWLRENLNCLEDVGNNCYLNK